MSNVVHYKNCKSKCLEDCRETSLSVWQNTIPLNTKELCEYNSYFDKFLKYNFQKLFALESYQFLVNGQNPSDLSTSLSNGSLCIKYINNYITLVTVESPTKSITKSHRDQRKFFIDKLGVIGGTLGVSAGMSVLSMIEVLVFLYLILNGTFHDVKYLWKKIVSYLIGKNMSQTKTSDLEANFMNEEDIEASDLEGDAKQIYDLYVSITFKLSLSYPSYSKQLRLATEGWE